MKEEIAVDEEDGVGKEVEVGEESKIELAVVSSGIFTGLEGHEASGTAQIIQSDGKYYVRFEEDFESTNGPDVHVYLGKDNEYAPETDMGLIKGNIGSQNYEVPKGVNVFDYN